MRIPEFRIPTDKTEWDNHVKRFGVEMIRCTSRDSRFSIPPKITILMFIADRKNAEQMKSWSGIRQFLEVGGYDIEDVRTTEPREADLLFICTDRDEDEDVEYLVSTISQGLLGLAPKHEVLVSGPRRYASPYGGLPNHPILLTTDFMVYGMCIIHEHIRTLHDRGAIVGRHMSMMLELEAMLEREGVVQTGKADASGKIDAFKSLLKSRGHDGGEARWVFAALDLLRYTRNILSHTPPHQPNTVEGYKKAAGELNSLTKEYSRPFGVPPESNFQDSYGSYKKWMTSLTQITSRWIGEYLKENPIQAGATSGPAP